MEFFCAELIVPYKILRKGKYPLILKAVTVINPVNGWSKVTEYNDKKATMFVNLVETTWLSSYPQVDDQVLTRNNQANKYETLYIVPYTIMQTWINGTVTLRMVLTTNRINIRRLELYYT